MSAGIVPLGLRCAIPNSAARTRIVSGHPRPYPHHFLDNQRSVKQLTHLCRFRSLKSGIATSIWRQEGYMAPKPKPARLVFAVGMALTILGVMTWAVAAPSTSSIYHPQLLLLY